MNNPNRDDFERMAQLAEFGAKRHDERRQVEFRVFIAYMTLLVLAFYQIEKIRSLNLPDCVIWVGLGFIHIIYLLWQIRLSRALVNDANRRDFYLKKAECLLHHLWEKPNAPFCPRDDKYVTIRLDTKEHKISKNKDETSEYALFNTPEPNIVLVSPMWKCWKHLPQLWQDWSRPFQILIPTAMIVFLIFALLQKC